MANPLDRLRALLEAATSPLPRVLVVEGEVGPTPFGPRAGTRTVRAEDARAIAGVMSVAPQLLAVAEAADAIGGAPGADATMRPSVERAAALHAALDALDAAINAHLPAEPFGSDVPDTVAAADSEASDRQQGAEPEASDG